MLTSKFFKLGFREMIPITTGVVPFGAVMGTVCAEAGLDVFRTVTMNVFLYSGTAQLAAVDLMKHDAAAIVVVLSGIVINLRFLLYSAGVAAELQNFGFWHKLFAAHTLTDQSFAVMSANHDKLRTAKDAVHFYFGTALCMWLTWHSSVIAGFVFGNFAPASWALDYAVPLSFLALVLPTLKNRKYIIVALFSSMLSVLLYNMPYKLGLVTTALLSITLAAFITRKKGQTP